MKTRDRVAKEIFEHLNRKLSDETKGRLSSSETRELVYALSEYVIIENFNTIFDHLHKFQTALIEAEPETEESDFIEDLKKL